MKFGRSSSISRTRTGPVRESVRINGSSPARHPRHPRHHEFLAAPCVSCKPATCRPYAFMVVFWLAVVVYVFSATNPCFYLISACAVCRAGHRFIRANPVWHSSDPLGTTLVTHVARVAPLLEISNRAAGYHLNERPWIQALGSTIRRRGRHQHRLILMGRGGVWPLHASMEITLTKRSFTSC